MRPGFRRITALCAAVVLIPSSLPAADPPAKPAAAAAAALVPYRLTDTKHVLVRVKINGKGPFNLILDTGAPAVFVTKKVADKAGLEPEDDGWAATTSFEIEGGLTVPTAKARVADLFQLEGMNGMGLAGVELHGVVGYNVLAQYRITYDFTADKLVWAKLDFTPPVVKARGKDNSQGTLDLLGPLMKTFAMFMGIKPDFTVTPRGHLGVGTKDVDGKVVVETVLAGGPAADAGFKPGDQIEAVAVAKSGKKPSTFTDIDTPKDLSRLMENVHPGQAAKVRVQRGGEAVTLTVTFGKGL